jgi:fluoride exporter
MMLGVDVDPDVDPVLPREPFGRVVVAVAAGGALGALARYGMVLAWPAGALPWSTLVINVVGCLLIGALMVLVSRAHYLVRPFVGVGILGGFTTFSAYAEQVRALLAAGDTALALGYLAGTLLAAVLAVQVGVSLTRWAIR